jgi:amidohydrolase
MKYSFLFFLFVGTNSYAQVNSLRSKINMAAAKIEQKVIEWRRDIHEHPELGNHEVRTAALIEKHLLALGMEVQTGIAHTGVVGTLRGGKPGPVVALRADMDALPITERTPVPFASKATTIYNGNETGVMHACGHDSHVAMLMGVAEVLTGIKNELKGTVKFIFQPAEEGVPRGEEGGAEMMVKQGVLNNPAVDVIFGLHINAGLEAGKIEYRSGSFYASVNDVKIYVKGRGAHGAAPWASVDPIVVAAQIINNLQTVISRNINITQNAGVVTIGSIHGGNRSNIIPEEVEMWGTLRALSNYDEEKIIERVKQIATKTAESAGAVAEVITPYSIHYPVTYNDPALTTKMLPSLQQTAGAANVAEAMPHTGGEDFSFFQQKIPGLFFNLGALPKGGNKLTAPSHHTADFYLDESGFIVGVKALANLAIDYMEMQQPKKKG